MSSKELETFWKRDADDSARLSSLLAYADAQAYQVSMFNREYYFSYFNVVKIIYRDIKPLLIKLGVTTDALDKQCDSLRDKALVIEKRFNAIEASKVSEALENVAKELEEFHDAILIALSDCGLYWRTIKKDNINFNRIEATGKHKGGKT